MHTDQQSCWSLGPYGGRLVDTPHADRLAAEGVTCTAFFATSAVCTPSRGCLLTGRYPHAHGAWVNNRCLHADEVTFAEQLRRHGYHTGYVGKWHLDGERRPGWVHPERGMGFEDVRFMFNRGHWQRIDDGGMPDVDPTVYPYEVMGDEDTYPTDWLTRKTIDFVEAAPADRPFACMLSIPDPHNPFHVRAPYDRMFDPADMPVPETLFEQGLPDWAEEARRGGAYYTEDRAARQAQVRRDKAQYCGMVKLIDDNLGRLLAALERSGRLDDTVVVFTSDHGEYMGEHGLMFKNQLYETAHRVPLIVRWPRALPAGGRLDRVLGMVDFQPTILSLLGVPACGREQGRDAAALLRGEPADRRGEEWVDEAHIHHSSFQRAGIFTPDWQLAYVRDRDPILFDRRRDPQQVRNRFGDDDVRAVVEELTERIVAHHEAVASPAREWLPDVR